jgi:hypothetical protein
MRFDTHVDRPEVDVVAGVLNGRAVVRAPKLDRGSSPV